ncbi:MAG: CHASE2 domain-containing protein [Candidatus Binatia bacterium]
MSHRFFSQHPKARSLINGACTGLCASIVALAFSNLSIFQTMEHKTWDWRMKHLTRLTVGEKIVVFHVDQGSLDAMEREGVGWPWFRSIYKHVLDFSERGAARAVVFDILFTEPSIWTEFTDDDKLFSEELRKHKKVYMGALFSTNPENREADPTRLDPFAITVQNNSKVPVPIANSVKLPIEDYIEAIHGLGNTIQHPDLDGVHRRISLFTLYKGKYYPSLPFAVAVDFIGDRSVEITPENEIAIGDRRIPLAPDGKMLIHYYGPPLTIQSFPVAKVIKA